MILNLNAIVGEKVSDRVAECTRPKNPKMRKDLGVLLDRWSEGEELKNTQGFRVVRTAGA
jgi:hypothetical protein